MPSFGDFNNDKKKKKKKQGQASQGSIVSTREEYKFPDPIRKQRKGE